VWCEVGSGPESAMASAGISPPFSTALIFSFAPIVCTTPHHTTHHITSHTHTKQSTASAHLTPLICTQPTNPTPRPNTTQRHASAPAPPPQHLIHAPKSQARVTATAGKHERPQRMARQPIHVGVMVVHHRHTLPGDGGGTTSTSASGGRAVRG
jgi:hypothetical protein